MKAVFNTGRTSALVNKGDADGSDHFKCLFGMQVLLVVILNICIVIKLYCFC